MATDAAQCLEGHELANMMAESDRICDSCGIGICQGLKRFFCRPCDYDICSQCAVAVETKATFNVTMLDAQKASVELHVIGQSAASVASLRASLRELGFPGRGGSQLFVDELCLSPEEQYLCTLGLRNGGATVEVVEAIVCPAGHKVANYAADRDGHVCDSCGDTVNTASSTCRQCDYDICSPCMLTKLADRVSTFNVSMIGGTSATTELNVIGPLAETVATLKSKVRKGLGIEGRKPLELFLGERCLKPDNEYLCKFGLRGGDVFEVSGVLSDVLVVKQYLYGTFKGGKGKRASVLHTTLDLELQPGVPLKEQIDSHLHSRLFLFTGRGHLGQSPPKSFADVHLDDGTYMRPEDLDKMPEDLFVDIQSLLIAPPPLMFGID